MQRDTTTRVLFYVIASLLLLPASVAFAPEAAAHGGQYRPGDAVPPNLREPSDPTPPPPPPVTGDPPPPVTTPGSTPTAPVAPVSPGATPAPATLPGSTQPTRGQGTQESFTDWNYWYHYNSAEIENLKYLLYHPLSSESPLFSTGSGTGQRGAQTRWTERRVLERVVPALLWAMDPKNAGHQDTESAAYIGLAKITRDPAHIPLLLSGLDPQAGHGQIIQESAALALGLLRRGFKEDQFATLELDRVRERLFQVVEGDKHAARVRGFAALAIGLLGDQPSGSGPYAGDRLAAETATTARLFERVEARHANPDLYAGLLLAIGMQSPDSLVPAQRRLLAECAQKGRMGKVKASDLTRAYAALALGRIGTRDEQRTLETLLLARRRTGHNVRRSAAIGLGRLARHVSSEERVGIARTLLQGMDRSKDASTHNFAVISLAYTLIEDLRSRETRVLTDTQADEVLLGLAKKGSYLTRGFGALALGLVLRELNTEQGNEVWEQFREKATLALRAGLDGRGMAPKLHAAFCTSVGIARDIGSHKALVELVGDRGRDGTLRGYAALGLGLTGVPTAEVSRCIAKALVERSSEELRRQTAVALGLLGNPTIASAGRDAVDLLLEELDIARTQSHKGQVVLALARIGDHRAVDHLIRILQDEREQALTRALACAGLGLIGDMEWIPSLARGTKDINYRASTDLINEFLSIL
jgi:HEAT repeat protein